MSNPTQPRAGVIGLGMIGGGVAVSLARSGHPATAVYDVRPEAADGLDGVPPVAASPAAVASASDVVLLAVVNADQARSVLTGDDGVLGALTPGGVVVLLSTVALSAVRDLAHLCAEAGVTLLDAGVTGGDKAADNGLVTMVGGTDEGFEAARPVLEAFSKSVVHCGPLGAGMVTKLARNLTTYAIWSVVREAASLAAAGGVDPATFNSVLAEADDMTLLHLQLLAADYHLGEDKVAWADGLAQKDLAAAQELAAELGVEVGLADLARARIRKVYAGDLDTPMPEDDRERGRVMMDRVYGPGFNLFMTEETLESPSNQHTLDHLFPNVWARPHLTLRDRRLLTVGATAMLGRPDLLEVQLKGALSAGELTEDQLRELALQLHYYAGWGNGTHLMQTVEKIIGERRRAEARAAKQASE